VPQQSDMTHARVERRTLLAAHASPAQSQFKQAKATFKGFSGRAGVGKGSRVLLGSVSSGIVHRGRQALYASLCRLTSFVTDSGCSDPQVMNRCLLGLSMGCFLKGDL
jgi:hypothetical protein